MSTATIVRTGVDHRWLRDFMEEYLAAWNSHDADRVLATMTEDIVYDDAAWPTQMRGHADVRPNLAAAWRAFPDLTFEVVEGPYVMADKPKAAFHWRGTATLTGPLEPPGFAPTGRPVVFEGADFHEYRDGKVSRLRITFDMADIMRQLGVLPAQGGREERAITKLANARGRLSRR